MPHVSRSTVLLALLSFSLNGHAQDPTKPPEKVEGPLTPKPTDKSINGEMQNPPALEFKDEIKPLPPVAIPDDPPPHEGAFFDLPLTIEPPDIIVVEILEALPGRPITGERLVRPDGTISLGFYGDVHVRGLTLPQAKAKIILHLRRFVNDETLGLIQENMGDPAELEMDEREPGPKRAPGTGANRNPFELGTDPIDKTAPAPEAPPVEKKPEAAKPAEPKVSRSSSRSSRIGRSARRPRLRTRPTLTLQTPKGEPVERPANDRPPGRVQKAETEIVVLEPARDHPQWVVIPPVDSLRAFVDFSNHNSRMYFVQGDVGSPGRLAFTGRDTVLDALNYAGGLVPTAEPTDIHLYRPARGGKPAKDYTIDLEAIRRGVATANLQMFPNDRLIVGRNPIVAKTIEVDRAGAGQQRGELGPPVQHRGPLDGGHEQPGCRRLGRDADQAQRPEPPGPDRRTADHDAGPARRIDQGMGGFPLVGLRQGGRGDARREGVQGGPHEETHARSGAEVNRAVAS